MLKLSLKSHCVLLFLVVVVGCFVGGNFLRAATLAYGKKPRARAIAYSQSQACKEIIKKQGEVGSGLATDPKVLLPLPALTYQLPPSRAISFTTFPAVIATPTSPRGPPLFA